ncbi:MAG: potassium-transporting ATPase subunit KdpC [Pseudomonadota bacterium]
MIDKNNPITVFQEILISGRVLIATMAVCCFLYGLLVLAFGQFVVPNSANGSLVRNGKGEIIGSELIAQAFTRPEYFWPRPSAVDYNASAAGGSNLSPTNPALRKRAETILDRMTAAAGNPLPADLVTASGSGLDPHITLQGALYQANRVASARGLSSATVEKRIEQHAVRPGVGFMQEPLVNVLLLNRALDGEDK